MEDGNQNINVSPVSRAEGVVLQRIFLIQEGFKALRWFIVGASFVSGIYILREFFRDLAGQTTAVAITALMGVDVAPDAVAALNGPLAALLLFSLLLNIMIATLYRRERSLREEAIAHLSKKTEELELVVDPHRTSSGLTRQGRTHPEDE